MATIIADEGVSPHRRLRVSVGVGETTQPFYVTAGLAVVVPSAGGTMKAQKTSTPASIVAADPNAPAVDWKDWTKGAAAVREEEEFAFATAIRFVAAGSAGGVAEIAS